jgi:hypothetical protein
MRSGRVSPFAIVLESCETDAVGARSAVCGRAHDVSPVALAVVTMTRAAEWSARSLHIPLSRSRDAWLAQAKRASVPSNHIPCRDRTRTSRLTGPWFYESLFPHSTLARGPPQTRRAKHLL